MYFAKNREKKTLIARLIPNDKSGTSLQRSIWRIMIVVIHALILLCGVFVKCMCTLNAYCLVIDALILLCDVYSKCMCTLNAYSSKLNDDSGHWSVDITLFCVRQMRIIQNARMIQVIYAFIVLWCVRQMYMVQNAIIGNFGHSCIY